MEKIDLNRAKRLTRILAGKEKPIQGETYEKKRQKTLVTMQLNEMKNTIMKHAREMIKNADPNDPFTREIYMFSFRGKFHQIEAGTHKIVKADAVTALLEENQDIRLYYICTNSGMCPLPNAYVGKGAKAIQLKDDAAVIDYIKTLTGVEIKESDL